QVQSQEILYLGGEDDHGDPTGKAHNQGIGDEFQVISQFQDPWANDQKTGHKGGNGQAFDPMFLDNAKDNDDKGARRTPDLYPAASEEGNQKARDNGGDQSLLRGDPRGDGKGNGQGQGHNAHDDPR